MKAKKNEKRKAKTGQTLQEGNPQNRKNEKRKSKNENRVTAACWAAPKGEPSGQAHQQQ